MGLIRNINFNIYVCRQRGKRGGGKAGRYWSFVLISTGLGLGACAAVSSWLPSGVAAARTSLFTTGAGSRGEKERLSRHEESAPTVLESRICLCTLQTQETRRCAPQSKGRRQGDMCQVKRGARKKEGGGEEANSSLLCSSLDFHQRLMRCGPPSLGRAIRFSPVRVPTSSRNTLVDTCLPQTPGAGQGRTQSPCKDFLEDGCQLLGDSARP